jgi:fatty acid desaturase
MQLRTTLNVDTYKWLDFVLIGLQFQIEHHLFTRLPSHNLRRARKLAKAIAKKHDIHYHEPGFFECNVEMWHQLKKAAMGAKKAKKADGGFYLLPKHALGRHEREGVSVFLAQKCACACHSAADVSDGVSCHIQ